MLTHSWPEGLARILKLKIPTMNNMMSGRKTGAFPRRKTVPPGGICKERGRAVKFFLDIRRRKLYPPSFLRDGPTLWGCNVSALDTV